MAIRITEGYLSSVLISDLNQSLNAVFRQQVMAGSMRRVNTYADDPRAGAETTIHGAAIRGHEEDPIGVPLDEVGGDLVGLLTERVMEVASHRDRFFSVRDALTPDRAARVQRIAKR